MNEIGFFNGLDVRTLEDLKEYLQQRSERLGKSNSNIEPGHTIIFVDTAETIEGTLERMNAGEYDEAENYESE
ncbi:hypothetical protein [Paenibacillus shenyangensis]|uniref:hypothetical protein n=1 Tax=Paenibacillus sp. A9 TaxID=1284352 RepID=UPI0003818716|nr:hypothetical protein [Paenibacillus sp. A9]